MQTTDSVLPGPGERTAEWNKGNSHMIFLLATLLSKPYEAPLLHQEFQSSIVAQSIPYAATFYCNHLTTCKLHLFSISF